MRLLVQHTSKKLVVAAAGPLAIAIWRGHVTAAEIPVVHQLQLDLVALHGKITCLSITRPSRGHGIPEAGVEAAVSASSAVIAPHLLGHATVIEASGVAAAIAHGIRARTLPHMTAPSEVFSTVASALSWIAALPGQAAELQAAVSLSVELELLGRGDEEEDGARVLPFPRGRRAG